MPFFEDTGLDPNVERGPLWGAFATLFDQLERFVALNLACAVQLVPLLLALMFPEWPLVLRLVLILYSVIALAAATGMLYAMVRAAVLGEALTMELARDLWRETALAGVLTLAPLYGLMGLLLSVSNAGWGYGVDVLARLLILLLAVCAMYWGPLFAENPGQSMRTILRSSARLFWRIPGRTLLLSGVVLLVMLIGAISIGGLFLVVPVLVALLQTHMVRYNVR